LTGLFALGLYFKFGLTVEALIYFVFVAALLVITFIDIDHRIIPDLISLPGIPIFFVASLAVPSTTVADSILGILAGGGILFAIAQLWSRLRNIEAMGMGDVKLLAMIGALIGWQGVFFTIFVSSAAGTLVGLPLMLFKGEGLRMEVPFGPFLAMGAVSYLFFGPEAIDWYFSF
jgi:leader peptidase (prepilin peptidase) / N-methyltransferase